jgi:heat shock protein HslJ
MLWQGGCNSFSAKNVRITGDRLFADHQVISTAMSCLGPGVADQEHWVRTFLLSHPYWQLKGRDRLQLRAGDTLIDLQEQPPGSGPKIS